MYMHMKVLLIFFICLKLGNLQKSHLKTIPDRNNITFDTINSKIYTIINKLLSCLNVDKDFTNLIYVQMLLMMSFHYYKITGKNHEIYKELKNRSLANLYTSSNINVEEIFQDVVNDEIDNINKNIANITNNIFGTGINNSPTEDNNSAEVLFEDLNELLSNLSDRTIESLIDPILSETEITVDDVNKSYIAENKSREIKAWKPLTSSDGSVIISETRRIYKGKKAKIKSYPFLVSIHIMTEFMCAGSIISKDMVITAASCLQVAYKNKLYGDDPRRIFVRVASDYPKRSGELIPIVKVFIHPQYDPVTLKSNVAIIKMLENIKHIKRRKVKRIKYDRRAETLPDDGTEVTILGWGAKDEKHKPNNFQKLAVADLDIYDINDCQEVYSKYYVTDTNFCAGFTYKGGGACMVRSLIRLEHKFHIDHGQTARKQYIQHGYRLLKPPGDVGGPAIVSGELVGLISFGPTVCGLPDAPTVFTKVGFYAQWIDDIVNQKITKEEDMTTTTVKSPELFIVPLYTTPSTSNTLLKSVTKRKMRAKPANIPEEVRYLKKIIQEYILSNSSVVDYLLNGDILEDEESDKVNMKENNDILINTEKYKAQATKKTTKSSHRVYKTTDSSKISRPLQMSTVKTVTFKLLEVKPTQPLRSGKTARILSDYDGSEDLMKKTTFKALYDISEISEEISDSVEKINHAEETSSYYEQGISIDEKEFKSVSKKEINETIITTKNISVSKWPKTTNLLINYDFTGNKTYGFNQTTTIANKTYNIYQNTTPKQETMAVENKTDIIKTILYDGVSHDYTTTTRVPYPLGVTMSISDEDFDYIARDRNGEERKRQPSSRESVNSAAEVEWYKRKE